MKGLIDLSTITKIFLAFSFICLAAGCIFMYTGCDSLMQDQRLKETLIGGFLFLAGTIGISAIYIFHQQKPKQ
jgi:hypothetical protein